MDREKFYPGDIVLSTSHPAWYSLHLKLLKWGIQRQQKKRGFKVWRHTHAVIYIGRVGARHVIQAVKDKRIDNPGTLLRYRDWCLSVTFPRAEWVRLAEILEHSDWDHYSMRAHTIGDRFYWDSRRLSEERLPSGNEVRALRMAAWQLIGKRYDVLQLLDFVRHDLFDIPRSRWRRILDMGKMNMVCSVGTAYVVEWARKSLTRELDATPWVRPFSDVAGRPVHIEATMPADYSNKDAQGYRAYEHLKGGNHR